MLYYCHDTSWRLTDAFKKIVLEYIISRELKHFPAERIDSVVYSFPETHRYM